MRNNTVLSILLLIAVSCAPRANVFTEYLSGAHETDIGLQGESAIEVFEGCLPDVVDGQTVVFYTDASCSVCITSAIILYKAFQRAGTDCSLVILLDGSKRDLFDYYWSKEFAGEQLDARAQICLSPKSLDLPKGFYVLNEGVVSSFSIWAEN